MSFKKLTSLIATVVVAVGVASTQASAVSVGAAVGSAKAESTSGVEQVHLRSYRHCHWKYGDRWCHGPHYGVPRVRIYIGPRVRLHRHRHHHH